MKKGDNKIMRKNKRQQKIISFILASIMLITVAISATAAPVGYGEELSNMPNKNYKQTFKDVPKSHWAFSYIAEMSERGVLSGYPNGYFYPDNNVTRGEFAKIMTIAAGLPLSNSSVSSYSDVKSTDWYKPYIETARYYLNGYVSGGNYYYLPESNALREDIAVALVKLKGYDTTGYDISILKAMFTDWQSISEGAQKYVAVAIEKGLISGYDDNTFRGQSGVTRAETSTLLWRAYQYGNGNKDFEMENLEPEPTVAPTQKPNPTKTPTQTSEPIIEPTREPEVTNEPTVTPEPSEEPEPEYTWEITTLTNEDPIDFIQAVPGGVSYMVNDKIYEVSNDGNKKLIFDASELEYNGSKELTRRDTWYNDLSQYGYNKYDDCYYVAVVQMVNDDEDNYILYNVTEKEIISTEKFTVKYATINSSPEYGAVHTGYPRMYFYKNGSILVNGTELYYNGKIVGNLRLDRTAYIVSDNDIYHYGETFVWNMSTDTKIDCDPFNVYLMLNGGSYSMPGNNKFYCICGKQGEELNYLTLDGDFGHLLNFGDIGNPEGKKIVVKDVIFGAISDDDSIIYFYDKAYGCIRKIQKI